jgi:hypothetical protein
MTHRPAPADLDRSLLDRCMEAQMRRNHVPERKKHGPLWAWIVAPFLTALSMAVLIGELVK